MSMYFKYSVIKNVPKHAKNVQKRAKNVKKHAKICISNIFGPNSKTCIFKACAAQGLTVNESK